MLRRRGAAALFFVSLAVYFLTCYGGVRSPDAEVMFLSAEALAARGSFALDRDTDWHGFGIARGRHGRQYSVFGPLTSIIAAPIVLVMASVVNSGAVDGVAFHPSHFISHGLAEIRHHAPRQDRRVHALHALVEMTLDPLVCALVVLLFYRLARLLCDDERSAICAAALLAFGTLLWSYSATFFSEPITMLFLLASLPTLVRGDEGRAAAWSGLCFGLVCAAHVTGVLFAPLYAILLWRAPRARIAAFAAGLALPLALLGSYDAWRFGSPFETGRQVDPTAAYEFGYGTWVTPWKGLYGLSLGTGKGLLPYCPAVLLGLAGLPALLRRHRALAIGIVAAAALRIVFVAARSDWHGGFCLGPRLILPLVPLLLLPIVCVVDEALRTRPRALVGLAVIAFVCAAQQLYFSLGEVFSYYHVLMRTPELGRQLFQTDAIYLGSPYSPLLLLHEGLRGPWLLDGIAFAPLFAGGCALIALGLAGLVFRLRR